MWLFQLLTLFPGKYEWVGSLIIPLIGVTLLFFLPFIAPARRLGIRYRPLPLAVGVMLIVGITYLTFMGFASAKPYGQKITVPDRALSVSEKRGLYLYADRECSYCHQINGQGGHRVGPDLGNVLAKHHSKDYVMQYIHDPKKMNSTSVMPKYDLPDSDLAALADFVLSLDVRHQPMKTVTRQEALASK
jgi:ubiquinol-cytochrome c reductase cytochrome b subunit